MHRPSRLITPIKRARGHGPAHSGTHHFWVQRVTALALLPLTAWFLIELISRMIGARRVAVVDWVQQPLTALALSALIIALFWHAKLGLQVVVEDYVHREGRKVATLLLINALIYGFGALSLFAIARLHFLGI